MKVIINFLRKLKRTAYLMSIKLDPPPKPTEYEIAVQQWLAIKGDRTLRIKYNLDGRSVVFDVGGYEGQWASDIYSKYQSGIYVFEPVQEFYEDIKERFSHNSKIRVFPFGLGSKNQTLEISLNENASSTHRSIGDNREEVQIVCISDFIHNHKIRKINLMKINIEGGEFELLEHLIESGLINSVENIQVQFHEFVEKAQERRLAIHALLNLTHKLTFEYPFVWENWAVSVDKQLIS